MQLELKRIHPEGIPKAIDQAERYRLLNEPAQAESICRDVLAVDAGNQEALRALILALTDQLGAHGLAEAAHEAREHVMQLRDPYDRAYYSGLVLERETRAYLRQPHVVRSVAYDGLREAMECYDAARGLRPGEVDAVLRWNSCARAIERERLEPATKERELPLE